MSYVICASPLAKIFLPDFQNKLMDDFETLYDEKIPFAVRVKTSHGTYQFEYNKPKLLGPKPTGNKMDVDWPYFVEWLCGGDSGTEYGEETKMTGIVKLPVQNDVMAMLASIVESGDKVSAKAQDAVKDSRAKARKISDLRITKAAWSIYEAYRKQTEMAMEDNKTYLPTSTEYLCVKLLSESIREKEGPKTRMAKEVKEMMSKMNDSGASVRGV